MTQQKAAEDEPEKLKLKKQISKKQIKKNKKQRKLIAKREK